VSRTKIGVISLGCSKNLVDTEIMLGRLDRAGCTFVTDAAEADVLIVNTCSFIDAAREESVRTILDAARLKTTGRLKRLVVAGCMVQRYRDELTRELAGEVDAFIGLDELDTIVDATQASRPEAATPLRSDLPILGVARPQAPEAERRLSRYLYDANTPRKLATPRWTAFVKIAEGCDHTCSFCAIPGFRGAFRSRPPEDVVAEAEALTRGGVREINLIAQDSSHFGRDRGDRGGLAGLLARLDAVPDLRWLRVHYLYPNTVTDRLIETMARCTRVVKYVDMPLQHAHPEMLKRMRRGGSAESHLELLGRFRKAMPEVAMRTTLIVGFPGETEQEFEELVAFVQAARFDHLGVFTYSHEEGTSAHRLADDVPERLKKMRRDRLMAVQQTIAFEKNTTRLGTIVEVLVEGAHPETEHLLVGRASTQAPDVDGQILINDGHADAGTFARVLFTETAGYDLVGRILGAT
jgi:ribosomal protein S12 methylthiotransferase